jgi:membrane-associated PAP2 superfamily phosphatase
MDKRFYYRQATLAMAGLLIVIALFAVTDIDLWVQDWLYRPASGLWLLDKHDATLRLLFYDGPKALLGLLVKLALLVLLVFPRSARVQPYRQGLAIVLISTLVTVSLVGSLKTLTNVPCPKNLSHFGGDFPYITLLHRVPFIAQHKPARCFPAGHASGGFALLSLFFLFRRQRNRWIGLGIGMTLGWVFGIYKMLIGDHFLSHTLVTMCLAWLVAVCVAACVHGVTPRMQAVLQRARFATPAGRPRTPNLPAVELPLDAR